MHVKTKKQETIASGMKVSPHIVQCNMTTDRQFITFGAKLRIECFVANIITT